MNLSIKEIFPDMRIYFADSANASLKLFFPDMRIYFAYSANASFNERAWKLRALRYALLPSSSCMLLELMEMLFPLISYIIVLQKRFITFNEIVGRFSSHVTETRTWMIHVK